MEAYPGAVEHIDVVWARDPFHVLISTVLSQRTRDQNTYNASKALFDRFDSPSAIASAPLDELIELVKPAGFPQVKAKAIKEICRRLHEDFDDVVPPDIDALLTLPMVAARRRTASFHTVSASRPSASTPMCTGSRTGWGWSRRTHPTTPRSP